MYNEDFSINPMFWITLIAGLIVILGTTFLFSGFLKKYLKVGKTKLDVPFEIREKQKHGDKILKNSYLILLALSFIYYSFNTETVFYLFPYTVVLLYFLITISIRIYREWKYAENPKTYIVSISETVVASVLLFAGYLLFPYQ